MCPLNGNWIRRRIILEEMLSARESKKDVSEIIQQSAKLTDNRP
jgi:hypothetical protein